MFLKTKRVYDIPEKTDGKRILVDRLWSRGLAKEKAQIDEWLREIAPSIKIVCVKGKIFENPWIRADLTHN